MKLYIVRHAQSKRNAGIKSSRDPELSELGLEQARRLGIYFRKVKLDKIYCSVLKRARNTLKECLPYLENVPVTYSKDMVEHSMGIYSSNGKDDWSSYVKAMKKSGLSLLEFRPKDGESYLDTYKRAGRVYEKLLSKHKKDKVLVVCHNTFGKDLILNALNLSAEEEIYFNLNNASVSILDIDRNGRVKSYYIDDFHHIIDYALEKQGKIK